MDGICSTHGEKGNTCKYLVGTLEGKSSPTGDKKRKNVKFRPITGHEGTEGE
jgi:hypothetical protein